MLWEQNEPKILLDLWAPSLIHLNGIYLNKGAGGVEGATAMIPLSHQW